MNWTWAIVLAWGAIGMACAFVLGARWGFARGTQHNVWVEAWADHPAPEDMLPIKVVTVQPTHWMPLPAPPQEPQS